VPAHSDRIKEAPSARRDLTQRLESTAPASPTEAATSQVRHYAAKEEISQAIDAAGRSMSKCHATLRRLRARLKNND
jgi:hypothetical protein